MPILNPNDPRRRDQARARRQSAADLAFSRPHPTHEANLDEDHLGPPYPMNFTKGLPHDPTTGLLADGDHYQLFVEAIFSGDRRDFRKTPLGHPDSKGPSPKHTHCPLKSGEGDDTLDLRSEGLATLRKRLLENGLPVDSPQVEQLDTGVGLRAWESQSAGLAFDLEGPDAQAVTMPPAPGLCHGHDELTVELAEVYAQALLRDIPFKYFDDSVALPEELEETVNAVIATLNELRTKDGFGGFDDRIVGHDDNGQPITVGNGHTELTRGNLFRGITSGDLTGPYLSQFLLIGNGGVNGFDRSASADQGQLAYGAIRADQRVRYAEPGVDYMTSWPEWYSVQCAADVSKMEIYADQAGAGRDSHRLMATPRDLATYVHYDALYEAYLNAALYLLGSGAKLDPGIPFTGPDFIDHQQGFAHFGGPHLLSLVTEVATRALKCVRFQKFNVHRRLRPEALAARMEKVSKLTGKGYHVGHQKFDEVHQLLEHVGLLELVRLHNTAQNDGICDEQATVLLPMAFTEGSPMHPTYGAGHATVAGACVTVLKAFFDGSEALTRDNSPENSGKPEAYQPCISDQNSGASELQPAGLDHALTVEGELNKLAANISIGRDWAGVHYYSDYVDSLRMGEEIATGILKEQKLMFSEEFHMSFTSFDGIPISI